MYLGPSFFSTRQLALFYLEHGFGQANVYVIVHALEYPRINVLPLRIQFFIFDEKIIFLSVEHISQFHSQHPKWSEEKREIQTDQL